MLEWKNKRTAYRRYEVVRPSEKHWSRIDEESSGICGRFGIKDTDWLSDAPISTSSRATRDHAHVPVVHTLDERRLEVEFLQHVRHRRRVTERVDGPAVARPEHFLWHAT